LQYKNNGRKIEIHCLLVVNIAFECFVTCGYFGCFTSLLYITTNERLYFEAPFLDQVSECKLIHAVLNSTVPSTAFDIVNKRKEIEKRRREWWFCSYFIWRRS